MSATVKPGIAFSIRNESEEYVLAILPIDHHGTTHQSATLTHTVDGSLSWHTTFFDPCLDSFWLEILQSFPSWAYDVFHCTAYDQHHQAGGSAEGWRWIKENLQ